MSLFVTYLTLHPGTLQITLKLVLLLCDCLQLSLRLFRTCGQPCNLERNLTSVQAVSTASLKTYLIQQLSIGLLEAVNGLLGFGRALVVSGRFLS